MEIYNEQVKDLLTANHSGGHLKVREHKVLGTYVEGLLKLAVQDNRGVIKLMNAGSARRRTAATKMNDTSSRSHAVFTLNLTEQFTDEATKSVGERVSRISLVDLAGSERQAKTEATGARLKEGANINKSLTSLGLVISALAKGGKSKFVPYRNSILTWLLKDNLGGNSKTVMVATISPSVDNLDETISTLRYADSAKQIVNHAVVNEDPNARMIRELREELELLRSQVGGSGSQANAAEVDAMKAQLEETQNLIKSMSMSWEEKLAQSEAVLAAHQTLLNENQAQIKGGEHVLQLQSQMPHLVQLNDGLDVGVTIYTIKEGMTRIGTADCDDPPQDVQLSGEDLEAEHLIIESDLAFDPKYNALMEVVTVHPIGDCYVNGKELEDSTQLRHGDVLEVATYKFRFNSPVEAKRMQDAGMVITPRRQQSQASVAAGEALTAEKQRVDAERVALQEEARQLKLRTAAAMEERSKTDLALAEATAHREREEKERVLKEAENEKLKKDLEQMRKRLELQDISRRRSLERVGAEKEAEDSAAKHAASQRERELGLERDKAALLATKAAYDQEEELRQKRREEADEQYRQELAKLQAQRESIAAEKARQDQDKAEAEEDQRRAAETNARIELEQQKERDQLLLLKIDAENRAAAMLAEANEKPEQGSGQFWEQTLDGLQGAGQDTPGPVSALQAGLPPSTRVAPGEAASAQPPGFAGTAPGKPVSAEAAGFPPGTSVAPDGSVPAQQAGCPPSGGASAAYIAFPPPASNGQQQSQRRHQPATGQSSRGGPAPPHGAVAAPGGRAQGPPNSLVEKLEALKRQKAARAAVGQGRPAPARAEGERPEPPMYADITDVAAGAGAGAVGSLPPQQQQPQPQPPAQPAQSALPADLDSVRQNLEEQRRQFMARVEHEAEEQRRADDLEMEEQIRKLRMQQQQSEDEILAMRLQMQDESDYKRESFLREQQLEADAAYALKLDAHEKEEATRLRQRHAQPQYPAAAAVQQAERERRRQQQLASEQEQERIRQQQVAADTAYARRLAEQMSADEAYARSLAEEGYNTP